jgi:lipopolysaccharide export system protein LptA
VRQIEGDRNARLVSTSATARTTVTSNHLDLEFAMNGAESTLENATATGNSVAESVPLPRPGTPPADTRVLRSDKLLLIMRPGGKEMDHAETEGPGTLDFLPNRPGQPKRDMKGDRIFINYGPDNHIQSVHSINVSTRTERPPSRSDPKPPPVLTQSKDLLAGFDASTSQLTVLKQTTDFQYQEGTRRATANSATLEQQTGLMTLDGEARAWDPTGSVTADRIVMNQKTGDYTADGHVASAREPDHQGKSSAMLSTDEVLQARADRMTSATHNTKIGYDGHAVAWQGANRVEADHLDIDRQRQVLQAHGHVISQFVDNPPKGSDERSSPSAAPVFTVVRAPDLIYTDQTREAFYKGGVSLARPGLTVDSHELRAFLNNSGADSSLNKAFADGAVKIVSTMTNSDGTLRTRTGTGEHAEYYAAEGKVILQGGKPLMVDSLKGRTSGKQLTWWANNDRLLVDGGTGAPAQTTILKK